MKTLKRVFVLTAAVCLVLSCSKSDSYLNDNMNVSLKKAKAEPTTITVPFKADFTGIYDWARIEPCAECGPWDPEQGEAWVMVYNEGGGTGTHLGNFTHYFEFCANFADGIYPGPSNHMIAWFTAANGDILYVACAGRVIPGRLEDHPDYVIDYFRDPWWVLGGTGRFENATGNGWTDDYDSALDPYSHHHWTGTITLVKGNH